MKKNAVIDSLKSALANGAKAPAINLISPVRTTQTQYAAVNVERPVFAAK